jgi:quercetin dioxygenase-like cupin family protein
MRRAGGQGGLPARILELSLSTPARSIWDPCVPVAGTPDGFTMRTTFPTNPDGVEVMLEQWAAGTAEPPHSHPGDDMTVVVEGKMVVQFFRRVGDGLEPDGDPLVLSAGHTGYVAAGRIHDARYLEACKLVYVHNRAFGFVAAE